MPSIRTQQIENIVLSNLSVGYRNSEYVISDLAFTRVPVTKEQGTYPILTGKESMKTRDTRRAPRAVTPEYTRDITNESFTCHEEALKAFADERDEQAAAGTSLDGIIEGLAMDTTDSLLLQKEIAAATILQTAGNYASGHTGTPSTKWDQGTGKMIDDINDYAYTILKAIGRFPNTIIPGALAWKAMQTNAQATGLLKRTDGPLRWEMLYSWFPFLSRGAVATTTNHVSGSGALVFDEDAVWLGYVAPTPMKGRPMEPTFGARFESRQRKVYRWFDEDRGSEAVKVSEIYVHQMCDLDGSSDTDKAALITAVDS